MLRKAYVKPEMMKPREVYPITIELFATKQSFQERHRIRVDVSTSDYPDDDPNPNSGEFYTSGHAGIVAKNTIYHDKEHPSHIIPPIIPMKQGQ
jgi:hypothetical protein